MFYIFIFYGRNGVTYVSTGKKDYLVQNTPTKNESAKLLEKIETRLYALKKYLLENIEKFQDMREYIELLDKNLNPKRTKIYEGVDDSEYTSYSVNKGEEIVFCLKSKKTGELHDINLIMYVALHEISHLACPEIDHTPLFKRIFAFICQKAIDIDIYKHQNYEQDPVEYCGMTLSSSII